MLQEIKQIHNEVKEINDRFEEVDQRFEKIDLRFDKMDERFDGIDRRLDDMDERFEKVDERLNGMDRRFDGIDKRLDGMGEQFDGIDKRFDGMDARFEKVEGEIVGLKPGLGSVQASLDAHVQEIRQDLTVQRDITTDMDLRMAEGFSDLKAGQTQLQAGIDKLRRDLFWRAACARLPTTPSTPQKPSATASWQSECSCWKSGWGSQRRKRKALTAFRQQSINLGQI